MRAIAITAPGQLSLLECERPQPGPGEVLIRVRYCGVCRTDLHILDGELNPPRWPIIPGHEVIGHIESCGPGVDAPAPGSLVGVPWLGHTCGVCRHCQRGQENLCAEAEFTGLHRHGGYADYLLADARFVFALPATMDTPECAPLLCAGLIGYRSLRLAGTHIDHLGLFGFGAAAHLLVPIARDRGQQVHAFTRQGDEHGQQFARDCGCHWAGDSDSLPPAELDAALIFAPAGELVPAALRTVGRGGRVVCGGIHMSDIPGFPYADLWGERSIRSVANLTRQDGHEYLPLADRLDIRARITRYPLEQAGQALDDLRAGRLNGAAVLDLSL